MIKYRHCKQTEWNPKWLLRMITIMILAPLASLVSVHHLTVKGIEQGWLTQCQLKVNGWGIM